MNQYTKLDVYGKKGLRTRAARRRKGKALRAALCLYEAACDEARAAGVPLPKLSSFLEGK